MAGAGKVRAVMAQKGVATMKPVKLAGGAVREYSSQE
jgi:hypothetical protein